MVRSRRLRRDAAADRGAAARGPCDAAHGRCGLRVAVELAGVPGLHEDEFVSPVRELYAVRHSAVHSHGRAGGAFGPVVETVSRRVLPRWPFSRRARLRRHRLVRGVRRHLRFIGGDDGDVRARGAAGARTLQIRRRLLHRRHCGRGNAGHSHPAVGDPRRLCDRDRAEHRQAVHGGAGPRRARGAVLLRRDLHRRAAQARSCARARPGEIRRNAAGRRRRVASSRDRVRGGGRHLRRRVHADRRGGRGRGGDVRHWPRATRARMAARSASRCCRPRPPRG